MAGSEQTGLEAADPYLFENAVYVLTPTTPDDEPLRKVRDFVESLGAQPLVMDAARHDRIVAAVSHLPHIVAAALVSAVAEAARHEPQHAGPGRWRLSGHDPHRVGRSCHVAGHLLDQSSAAAGYDGSVRGRARRFRAAIARGDDGGAGAAPCPRPSRARNNCRAIAKEF